MEKMLSISCAYIFPRYLECPPPDRPERNKVYHMHKVYHTSFTLAYFPFLSFLSLSHILSFIFSFFLVLSALLKGKKIFFFVFSRQSSEKDSVQRELPMLKNAFAFPSLDDIHT